METPALVFQNQSFADVLKNRSSLKVHKIRRKTTVLKSLLQSSFRFTACNIIKKETSAKIFFCALCEIFKNTFLTEHHRMTVSCVYLCILRNFSEHLHRTPPGNCSFHVQGFRPAHTLKNYFTGAFQAFCTKTRSSHSKEFI